MAQNQAIVIGINNYRFLQSLNFAKQDAEAIRTFLLGDTAFDQVFLFTDQSPPIGNKSTEPFRANILRVLRQISERPFMGDGDNFWFFFSGHGSRYNERDYLMPLDGDPEDIENTGISTSYITERLRRCGADNVVLILDACRDQGRKAGEGIGHHTERESRQRGVISFFSCSPDQYSYEVEAIQHGAFTAALLEGLGNRGRCATVKQLNQYLENRVPEIVQQYIGDVRQTPYTVAEPISKSHLILIPEYATSTDIATLKNDAYQAEVAQSQKIAKLLWLRVLVATSGRDMEAVNAIERIGQEPLQFSNPVSLEQDLLIETSSLPVSKKTPVRPQTAHSPKWTRQRFLKWAIPAGIGAIGASILGPKLFNQLSLYSEAGFGLSKWYAELETYLKAGQWRQADLRTGTIVAFTQSSSNDFSYGSFPCDVLSRLNQLWVQYSPRDKFGFSVQVQIYMECVAKSDGRHDEDAWNCFGDQVKWRVDGKWISLSEVVYDKNAPRGHLPFSNGHRGFFPAFDEPAPLTHWDRDFLTRIYTCRI